MPLPFDYKKLEDHLCLVVQLPHDSKETPAIKNAAKFMVAGLLQCIEELLVDLPYEKTVLVHRKETVAKKVNNFIRMATEKKFEEINKTLKALLELILKNEKTELRNMILAADDDLADFIQRFRDKGIPETDANAPAFAGIVLKTGFVIADEVLRKQAAFECQQGNECFNAKEYAAAEIHYQKAADAIDAIKKVTVKIGEEKFFEDEVLRCQEMICQQQGNDCWDARNYKDAKKHYQAAADSVKRITAKTEMDEKNLELLEDDVLRCEGMIRQQQGDDCWDAGNYKDAKVHYQVAADSVKRITAKTANDEKNLKLHEDDVLRCEAMIRQ